MDRDYDEDTIVRLVTDLYHALVRIGGIESSDVVWPPAGGHSLDFSSLSDEARIDMRVVSLMQKLPFFTRRADLNQILPTMYSIVYTDPEELARSRDIDKRTYYDTPDGFLDMSNALPTMLMLFEGRDGYEKSLVIDISDNTVREIPGSIVNPFATYLDVPAVHAPEYLRQKLDQYQNCELIPDMMGGIVPVKPQDLPWTVTLRRILTEDYGWPDDFKREQWRRDGKELVHRLSTEYNEAKRAEGVPSAGR